MAKSTLTFAQAKAETVAEFSKLDSFQEAIQRMLVGSYPTNWAKQYVEWLLDACAENPRRQAAGDKIKGYLTGIGAMTTAKVMGVTVVTIETDKAKKRRAYDTMKASFWTTWKPVNDWALPELGESVATTLAKRLAAGAMTESEVQTYLDSVMVTAMGKIGSKPVSAWIEKGIGAGKLIRDEKTGMVKPVAQKGAEAEAMAEAEAVMRAAA